MAEPLVSVVVISYNQAQYIIQSLDSLKSQTHTNWELIVADDASRDHSVGVFKNWLNENNISAKKIFHTKNTGLATVLNEAIELCAGEYVKFIAADDYMHPECLEKSVRCLEEKGKEYGMVHTDTFCVDENSNFLPDFADFNISGNVPPLEFRELLLINNRISAPTALMRTGVVKETGEYLSKFLVEDYQRWLMISEKYFIAYIPQKLTYYRWHSNNISKSTVDRRIEEDRMLQMMFDQKGMVKDLINHYMQDRFVAGCEISQDLLETYRKYPFRKKTLAFFIEHNFPEVIFKMIYSLSLRLKFLFPPR